MNYAQIKHGKVSNIIVLDDESLIEHFSHGFEFFIAVDGLEPQPHIGWGYDGTNFIPAPLAPPFLSPADFGSKLMQEFSKYNQSRGLTADQRLEMAKALAPYALMVQSGDLEGFVDVVGTIPVDDVLVTQPIIDYFVLAISSYLNGTPGPVPLTKPTDLPSPTDEPSPKMMSKKKKGR